MTHRTLISAAAVFLCLASAWAGEPNRLSADESAHGWTLLFDGKTTNGWTGMKGTPFPETAWRIEDGAFRTLDTGRGDLVTTRPFENFELSVDWKITPGGNSGVKYLVHQEWLSPGWSPGLPEEQRRRQALGAIGPEYQIIDDEKLASANKPGWEKSSLASAYLLYAPEGKEPNPPGEWNTAKIVVNGTHVEHWLNGKRVLEYEMSTKAHLAKVKETKFARVPGFGVKGPGGHIVLTHHGSPVWFRNIKVRELPPSPRR